MQPRCAGLVPGFSIHALREEGDRCGQILYAAAVISIHALREEGDQDARLQILELRANFYPRPPRGGRPLPFCGLGKQFVFLSTPSARRTTRGSAGNIQRKRVISIHALREEGDGLRQRPEHLPLRISIHALREEGDPSQDVHQSLRPPISIHALREEGDRGAG